MRATPPFHERLFGHWLVITLTLVLSATAVLAGIGLFRELTRSSVTVVAVHASPAAPGADNDSADPLEHAEAAAPIASPTPGQPITAEASPAPAGSPGPGAAALTASPTPVIAEASPGPVNAEASPAPGPPAARVRPEPGPRGSPRATADLPLVMYHHIGPLPPNPDIFRRDLTVSPAVFEKTLEYLAEQEIETVTMADIFEHFAGGPALPKKAINLTFDDGYDDAYEHAFRLLKARGMVGTFYVTTDFVERPGYLTWAQIAEMAEAGMEIAAHSSNHADFTTISANELRRQLVEPKQLLEKHLGQPVKFLAYPAGKYNATVMAAARAAGYQAAVTVIHGTRHSPAQAFELRRVRARGADTVNQITSRITLPSWR